MKQKNARQSGYALAAVMAGIFILMAIGVSLMGMSSHVRQQASRNTIKIAARTAADATLQMALVDMQARLASKPWNNSKLPNASGLLPNSQESYAYQVTGDIISGYTINATGTSGLAQSNITARFKTVGLFEHAILVKKSIDLGSKALVDGINYGFGDRLLEIVSKSGLPNSIILGSGVTVKGDVLVGAGGDPGVAVQALPGSNVTGDIGRMMDIWDPPIIAAPKTLTSLASLGTLTSSTTLTTNSKIDKINLSISQVLTIKGPVEIYVAGDIILSNSAQIQVDALTPNSSLTIYAGGNIEVKGGSRLAPRRQLAKLVVTRGIASLGNKSGKRVPPPAAASLRPSRLSSSPLKYKARGAKRRLSSSGKKGAAFNNLTADAKKLMIYGQAGCTKIDFKNSGKFYGTIYAPNADVLLYNSLEMTGAVVSRSFIQKTTALFHYDVSLRKINTDDIGLRFVIDRWSEK